MQSQLASRGYCLAGNLCLAEQCNHQSGTKIHFRNTEPAVNTQDHQINRLQTVGLQDG